MEEEDSIEEREMSIEEKGGMDDSLTSIFPQALKRVAINTERNSFLAILIPLSNGIKAHFLDLCGRNDLFI